jgi:hypothetical protein
MKNYSRLFACTVVAVLSLFGSSPRAQLWTGCGGHGKSETKLNSGTEFLICFMQNELQGYDDGNASSYRNIYLASLDDTATVTFTCGAYPGFKKSVKLGKRDTLAYPIENDLHNYVLINSDEIVDDGCVKVVATSPIVCYGMNHKQYTADAFVGYPKNVADLDYMVMAYQNSAVQLAGERASEFLVAAFEDSTNVDINASDLTMNGTNAGVKQTFMLNAAQAVQVHASTDATRDLTGSLVHANKPIVVYGGHVRAEVPFGFTYPGSTTNTSRDHLAESIPPTSTWGYNFVCQNFLPRTQGDYMRVLSSNAAPSNLVKINGVPWVTLGPGQSRDTLITRAVTVETSAPSLVGMLAHTTTITNGLGDPFLAIMPPVDQAYHDFTFFISVDSTSYSDNFVQVVTERSGKGLVQLNGVAIPAISFIDLPGTLSGQQYSIATIGTSGSGSLLNRGTNRITTPNLDDKGITILAYGFGPVDSYGYTAGAKLVPKRGVIGSNPGPMGIAPGSNLRSQAHFHSIVNDKIWLDSAVVTSVSDSRYTVRAKKDVALDIGSLTAGQSLDLDLDVFPPLTSGQITGTMKLYHHSTQWGTMDPAITTFAAYPEQTAGVNDGTYSYPMLSAYPNPVTGEKAIVSVTLEKSSNVRLRLFDAAGREIMMLASGRMSEGTQTLSIDTKRLPAGVYMIELTATDLGKIERSKLVVLK